MPVQEAGRQHTWWYSNQSGVVHSTCQDDAVWWIGKPRSVQKKEIADFESAVFGKTKMQLDKQAVKRLEDISKLPEENNAFVLNLIDMALRDFKVKKAYAS